MVDWGGKVAAWFAGVTAASVALATLIGTTAKQPFHGELHAAFIILVIIASVSFTILLLTGPRAVWVTLRNQKIVDHGQARPPQPRNIDNSLNQVTPREYREIPSTRKNLDEIRSKSSAHFHRKQALVGSESLIDGIKFTPDGRFLVGAGTDGFIRVWNSSSGALVRSLNNHESKIFAVSNSFIVGYSSMTVQVWETASGHQALNKSVVGFLPTDITALTPDGGRGASAVHDNLAGAVLLWTSPKGETIFQTTPLPRRVTALSFSPDGSILAAASEDTIYFWDTETRKLRTSAGHAGGILDLCFSFDGKFLITAEGDGAVRAWDGVDGTHVRTYSGHTQGVASVSLSRDGRMLATADAGTVRLFDFKSAKIIQEFSGLNPGNSKFVNSVAFDAGKARDSALAMTTTENPSVLLWRTLWSLNHHLPVCNCPTLGRAFDELETGPGIGPTEFNPNGARRLRKLVDSPKTHFALCLGVFQSACWSTIEIKGNSGTRITNETRGLFGLAFEGRNPSLLIRSYWRARSD